MDIVNIDSRDRDVFCEGCGRRLDRSSDLKARCVVCGKRLCGNCVRESNNKLYCEEHQPSCFIATAAYGTPMAEEIDVLRKWRDENLMKSSSGRLFVNVYYITSQPIANLISKSDKMRALTRELLKPIVNHFNN